MRSTFLSAAALSFALAACGSPEGEDTTVDETMESDEIAVGEAPMAAAAELMTLEGEAAGTVNATSAGEGVLISVAVNNLPPGMHGVHVHTTGQCEAPFESAGPHWNPTGETHGLEGPEGQHAGDMPNLEVGEDGTGSLEFTLGGGATFAGLMDADGSAFLVHAMEDDQTTDPSGDSGDRIACGVFAAGDGAMAGAPGSADTM